MVQWATGYTLFNGHAAWDDYSSQDDNGGKPAPVRACLLAYHTGQWLHGRENYVDRKRR